MKRWVRAVLMGLVCGVCLPSHADWATPDGAWRLRIAPQRDASPSTVEVLDREGRVQARHPLCRLNGRCAAGIDSAVVLNQRRSFVLAPQGLPEIWEISLDPQSEPIFDGLVHDHRMGEAVAKPGFLGVRRSPLNQPMRVVGAGQRPSEVLLSPQDERAANAEPPILQVLNLDVRRIIRPAP